MFNKITNIFNHHVFKGKRYSEMCYKGMNYQEALESIEEYKETWFDIMYQYKVLYANKRA